MRERSQEKGRAYQRLVTRWLAGAPLFGFSSQRHGDAYDVTAVSAEFGNKQFDFSLTLFTDMEEHAAVGIAYVECKYRSGGSPETQGALDDFLCNVIQACGHTKAEERKSARFVFVASAPPSRWGDYLTKPLEYLRVLSREKETRLNDYELALLATNTEILVLTEGILGGVA